MDERTLAELGETIDRLELTARLLRVMRSGDRDAAIRLSSMWPRNQYEGSVCRVRLESWIAAVLDVEEDE